MTSRQPSCKLSAAADKQPGQGLGRSFRFAGRGLRLALQERNLRIHLLATGLVVAAGLSLRIAAWQWGLLILAITLVLVTEIINTSLEYVVDLASPGYAELARMAKDVAAGAVLFAALAALALGNVIFAPSLNGVLARLRDIVPTWPTAFAIGCAAVALLCLAWQLRREHNFALICSATVVVAVGARVFVWWPCLPVVTAGALLLFAAWVLLSGRFLISYLFAVLSWLLLCLWLW